MVEVWLNDLPDLPALTRRVRDLLGAAPLEYIPGKTMIRNAVMDDMGCSAERAEALVDLLESRGYIEFMGSSMELDLEPAAWRFVDQPP